MYLYTLGNINVNEGNQSLKKMNQLKMDEDISGATANEDVSTTPNVSYKIIINDCLKADKKIYKIRTLLGEGAYGQVVKCTNNFSKREVAVKILNQGFNETGRNEIKMLRMIRKIDQGKNFVQEIHSFEYKKHICIAFEMLEQNLHQFMNNHTVPSQAICYILNQLLSGLVKLKQIGIVHTDLKPDNIMMVNSVKFPYRVKIIDFGMTSKINEIGSYTYFTTRAYRSPEVLLNIPSNEKIDIWSLGCIAAELLTKCILYFGTSELEQLRCICTTLGMLPESMLNKGYKTHEFFYCDPWTLKPSQDSEGIVSVPAVNCLNDLITLNILDDLKDKERKAEIVVRTKIVDLIKKMLELDPKKRITCVQALKHEAVSQYVRWNKAKSVSKI